MSSDIELYQVICSEQAMSWVNVCQPSPLTSPPKPPYHLQSGLIGIIWMCGALPPTFAEPDAGWSAVLALP